MKKKYIRIAEVYAVLAMIAGVFYREYTKFHDFTGVTMLSKAHAHLFLTGMFVFLLIALAAARVPIEKEKSFRTFMILYNIGVPLTALMMIVRGILQVNGTALSSGMDHMISGMAGIGHCLMGIGFLLLLRAMRKAAEE